MSGLEAESKRFAKFMHSQFDIIPSLLQFSLIFFPSFCKGVPLINLKRKRIWFSVFYCEENEPSRAFGSI